MSDEAFDAAHAVLLDDDAEALYERAPCGYLSTTADGTIIKVNQTFLTWIGRARADLVGRETFSNLLTAGGRIYHETHYAPMLQMQGSARAIALDIVRADGTRLPVLVSAVLERGTDDRPAVIRIAIFDATERRDYERELQRAMERAQGSEERALMLVRTLQQVLVPPAPPHIPGLDLEAVYRPAGDGSEVGGDFYDVFELGLGDWVITVGDVRGKGIGAAILTALARHTVRGAAVRSPRPSDILSALNDELLRESTDRFCTVVAVRVQQTDLGWKATICCGGHPLPLLQRRGLPPSAVGRPGSLLGVFAGPTLHDVEVELRAGDELVLYTDGVTEGRRDDGTFFGEERFARSVAAHGGDARGLVDGILDEVLAFQAGSPRDDTVIVALRVPAP